MLASTTDELKDLFRDDVDDPEEGVDANSPDSENLWKNVTIYRYMTTACDRLAKKTEGLYKTFVLPITAGNPLVSLPSNVLHVRLAWLVTGQRWIEPANLNDLAYGNRDDYGRSVFGGGATNFTTTGTPSTYVRDMERKALRLSSVPEVDDTLSLQCSVTLGVPLVAGMPLPFLDTEDQELLLIYMKKLAYSKHDADTLDMARSNAYDAEFNLKAQERADALRNYRRTPGVIRMNW